MDEQLEDQRQRMSEWTGSDNFIRRIFMQSRITQFSSQLDSYDAQGNPKPHAMGVRESRFITDSPLYIRGEID